VRRLVTLLGALAFAVAGLFWLAHGPGGSGDGSPGSSFDTSPSGASLAFAYLQGSGRAVERLTRPLRPADVPPEAVVFRLRPPAPRPAFGAAQKATSPIRLLAPREEAWVEAGGRLVLAVDASLGPLKVESAGNAAPPRRVHPRFAGVDALLPAPRRVLAGAAVEEAVTLFASGDRPVVARVARGTGEVLLLACPEVLENGLLAGGDHLLLLEALSG